MILIFQKKFEKFCLQRITEVDSAEESPASEAKSVAATECVIVCVDKECDVVCETKTLLEPLEKQYNDNRTLVWR